MTVDAKQLLSTFDSLPQSDKHEVAVEILRRVGRSTTAELSDEAITEVADERFGNLDGEESATRPA
jgi:hypothetical protein